MGMKREEIESMILKSIPDANIEIKDLAGDENHYAAKVVSKEFINKTKIQQHKMVYDALQGKMGGTLHALSLTTEIPND
jgi:stress-induced morphogen